MVSSNNFQGEFIMFYKIDKEILLRNQKFIEEATEETKKHLQDVKDGDYVSFWDNGNIESKYTHPYEDKNRQFQQEFYENGNLKYEGIHHFQTQVGLCRTWYENGQVKSEEMFCELGKESNGNVHGNFTIRRSYLNAKNRRAFTSYRFWDKDGKLLHTHNVNILDEAIKNSKF
jgi:antitoxin component YwqK of YwqJK toxin-antitoxin module